MMRSSFRCGYIWPVGLMYTVNYLFERKRFLLYIHIYIPDKLYLIMFFFFSNKHNNYSKMKEKKKGKDIRGKWFPDNTFSLPFIQSLLYTDRPTHTSISKVRCFTKSSEPNSVNMYKCVSELMEDILSEKEKLICVLTYKRMKTFTK